ncbi:hypothetical protein FGG08_001514 [Glutinoglossum americanum]|uniref:HECT-type E3 ubiquitin transferase n=1 Tax=Glutinoglossum americanum TaxID=1670608 RepID=A0A9P8IGS1_9PEZI|nr:hypothetical protein FGG08_001514 [Glutinoglossum americanum]
MFQSFTGSSRRPRQVNLSGRNPNPFAASSASNTALVNAQQERFLRKLERDRLNATKTIQRLWRGHSCRSKTKNEWRDIWDQIGDRGPGWSAGISAEERHEIRGPESFKLEDECLDDLRILLYFADLKVAEDMRRLDWFIRRLLKTIEASPSTFTQKRSRFLLLRLERLLLDALMLDMTPPAVSPDFTADSLSILDFLTRTIPKDTAQNASQYYRTLSRVTVRANTQPTRIQDCLLRSVLCPLEQITSETVSAYEAFATAYLSTPNLQMYLRDFDGLMAGLNYRLLAMALAGLIRNSPASRILVSDVPENEGQLWLLAYFIYSNQLIHGAETPTVHAPDPDYVAVVSTLLCSLADEISARIDVDAIPVEKGPSNTEDRQGRRTSIQKRLRMPLPNFVRYEILSLVNQRSIASLLARTDGVAAHGTQRAQSSSMNGGADARHLAGYALTLLRVFPRRGDEIRMWLYLGSTSAPTSAAEVSGMRLPAIKYFWKATQGTSIYKSIYQDQNAALRLLRPRYETTLEDTEEKDKEWGIILLFLELYTFVLKVMDDEEFLSGGAPNILGGSGFGSSWTRESALPLGEVKEMTVFLKNLAFTMYWNASEISGMSEPGSATSISSYFNTSGTPKGLTPRDEGAGSGSRNKTATGLAGVPIDHVKGIVTGLLRMVYERDSRRRFLPKDHWLMTSRFDMDGFIPDVVAEEESRHKVQEADDEDDEKNGEIEEEDNEEGALPVSEIIGTRRTQHTRNLEVLRRQQRKASRKKYLEAVTPRLEILQNMPFFIPFTTRVQIFRQFVLLDQTRRRGGHIDPDNWRLSIIQGPHRGIESRMMEHEIISRHHAKIKRDNVFEDAYDQFYELGEGLKEPIQITFVDRFDTVEAGIDGGGVTKEFLTSVTKEAFSPSNGLNLFVENDHNLLYPNPSAAEERKDLLREAAFREGSPDWNDQIRELLRRYEFLGRIIGKCLYEGILVDVVFAGFFLLKWALTGGSGVASRESGYRANLNDLRDLDEGLYQGLLQLKNYEGDVEDFSLNFTVTDTISAHHGSGGGAAPFRTITHELKPGGSNIPVTNENRLVYISYIARHRLQLQPHLQTNAFLRGLGEIIQPSWLSMFNQSELQTLVGGDSSEIDVVDLRRNTLYGGVYAVGDDQKEHPCIQLFWEVMASLSDVERRNVLKFVTSTPRAPLLGFGQLNPRFSIRDAGDDQERLPSTSTCVNLLKLPRYKSEKTMREKLLYAVNAGAGFDLS